jgi:hypothetical protein
VIRSGPVNRSQEWDSVSYVGSSIGNIRIESRLGQGGMGEVYLGYDSRLERRVAVKTIRPEKRLSPRLKARFLREARLLSKLGHPSICQAEALAAREILAPILQGKPDEPTRVVLAEAEVTHGRSEAALGDRTQALAA